MKVRHFITAALSATALMGFSAHAFAGEALIQGVGFWGAGTAVTAYSAPDESFQFSFDVPDPLDSNPTPSVTNFFYSLNGALVTNSVDNVEFFDTAVNGLFDLNFPDETISIYGADIGSSGDIGPDGFYAATAGVNDLYPGTGTGGVTVTVTSAAPEPASWLLMIAGIGGMGLALKAATAVKKPEEAVAA